MCHLPPKERELADILQQSVGMQKDGPLEEAMTACDSYLEAFEALHMLSKTRAPAGCAEEMTDHKASHVHRKSDADALRDQKGHVCHGHDMDVDFDQYARAGVLRDGACALSSKGHAESAIWRGTDLGKASDGSCADPCDDDDRQGSVSCAQMNEKRESDRVGDGVVSGTEGQDTGEEGSGMDLTGIKMDSDSACHSQSQNSREISTRNSREPSAQNKTDETQKKKPVPAVDLPSASAVGTNRQSLWSSLRRAAMHLTSMYTDAVHEALRKRLAAETSCDIIMRLRNTLPLRDGQHAEGPDDSRLGDELVRNGMSLSPSAWEGSDGLEYRVRVPVLGSDSNACKKQREAACVIRNAIRTRDAWLHTQHEEALGLARSVLAAAESLQNSLDPCVRELDKPVVKNINELFAKVQTGMDSLEQRVSLYESWTGALGEKYQNIACDIHQAACTLVNRHRHEYRILSAMPRLHAQAQLVLDLGDEPAQKLYRDVQEALQRYHAAQEAVCDAQFAAEKSARNLRKRRESSLRLRDEESREVLRQAREHARLCCLELLSLLKSVFFVESLGYAGLCASAMTLSGESVGLDAHSGTCVQSDLEFMGLFDSRATALLSLVTCLESYHDVRHLGTVDQCSDQHNLVESATLDHVRGAESATLDHVHGLKHTQESQHKQGCQATWKSKESWPRTHVCKATRNGQVLCLRKYELGLITDRGMNSSMQALQNVIMSGSRLDHPHIEKVNLFFFSVNIHGELHAFVEHSYYEIGSVDSWAASGESGVLNKKIVLLDALRGLEFGEF